MAFINLAHLFMRRIAGKFRFPVNFFQAEGCVHICEPDPLIYNALRSLLSLRSLLV
jgi:hypothetical protein